MVREEQQILDILETKTPQKDEIKNEGNSIEKDPLVEKLTF